MKIGRTFKCLDGLDKKDLNSHKSGTYGYPRFSQCSQSLAPRVAQFDNMLMIKEKTLVVSRIYKGREEATSK